MLNLFGDTDSPFIGHSFACSSFNSFLRPSNVSYQWLLLWCLHYLIEILPPLMLYWSSQHGNTCSLITKYIPSLKVVSMVLYNLIRYATGGDRQIAIVRPSRVVWAMEKALQVSLRKVSSPMYATYAYYFLSRAAWKQMYLIRTIDCFV
jgi:hypothetical protein